MTKTGRRIAKSWSLVFPGECCAVDEQNENTLDSVSEHPHSTECKELGRWCYWENKWREWERGESQRGGRRQLPFFSLWHRCEMQECAGFKHRSGQIWFGMHPDLVHFRMLTTLSAPFFNSMSLDYWAVPVHLRPKQPPILGKPLHCLCRLHIRLRLWGERIKSLWIGFWLQSWLELHRIKRNAMRVSVNPSEWLKCQRALVEGIVHENIWIIAFEIKHLMGQIIRQL